MYSINRPDMELELIEERHAQLRREVVRHRLASQGRRTGWQWVAQRLAAWGQRLVHWRSRQTDHLAKHVPQELQIQH